ncbi:hypothetical protein HELRODRAFT_159027 [Helobdella robusta]|uniref:Vitellogenin domain-containing protein n=1 Tax=Helobdella robusta TaxID=6412 RepID=T1ENH9_HELRO|nr:hypothetical protein HELRODRAFT_159027 [Helobdella robusta]ESO12485.1 hypothetical protein HELRODRAFT_159027 [Helobdella robusta]
MIQKYSPQSCVHVMHASYSNECNDVMLSIFVLCSHLCGWHSIPSSGALIEFVPGRSYEYLYQTQVKLDDKSRHQQTNKYKASGYKAYTKFKVASIWSSENLHEHIIKLSASDKPHGNLPPQDKHFESILKSPSYFHWNNGLVQYIYTHVTPSGELNMLKSLIDTFQLHSVLETQKFIQFADIRGQCNVTLSMDDNNELTANKTCINRSYLQRSTSYYLLGLLCLACPLQHFLTKERWPSSNAVF